MIIIMQSHLQTASPFCYAITFMFSFPCKAHQILGWFLNDALKVLHACLAFCIINDLKMLQKDSTCFNIDQIKFQISKALCPGYSTLFLQDNRFPL